MSTNIFQPRRPPPATLNQQHAQQSSWQRERTLNERAQELKSGPFQPITTSGLDKPAATFLERQNQRQMYVFILIFVFISV